MTAPPPGPWLADPRLARAFALLRDGGHRAWAAGGAVRDDLMGRAPGDVDLATDATPDRVVALAAAAGIKAVPTGFDHGTVTLVVDGRPFEVTTLRRDVETDGRHAVVRFGADLAEDAARRDFTLNALYRAPDGTLLDPIGGLPDALARKVRFVGDARARVREDHLRSLRFFRFHATHGDPEAGLDPDALDAVARHLEGLDALSRERVTAELLKLLAAPDPAPAAAGMRATGALARVLPGASDALLAPLVHVEGLLGLPPEPLRRLAALGGEASGLRLSRAQARRLAALRDAAASAMGAGELGYRLGADAPAALALRAAAQGRPVAAAEAEAARAACGLRLPVTAADLAPLAGPALGERLRAVERAWIAGGFRAGREALLGE